MKTKAFVYIILTGVLWGTSSIFFNVLTPLGFSPLQMTAMRGGVAAVVMSVYVFIRDRALFKISLKELVLFALSGFAVFGTASSYFTAIEASSVSAAVVLMYTAPVFVLGFSVAFLGEKLNFKKLMAVAAMLAGCVFVSGIMGNMNFSVKGFFIGLLSGVCYSAYNIITKIEMMNKSNSTSASMYCFIFMGATAILFSNPVQMVSVAAKNPALSIPLMIGIGVFTCVLPYFLYTKALKDMPVGTATALGIIEPMAATVFSVVIFGERIGALSLSGIILILAAVFVLGKSEE